MRTGMDNSNPEVQEGKGKRKKTFPKFGNGKGMKKSIPIIRERESEAFILGNRREWEFPLTPEARWTWRPISVCKGIFGPFDGDIVKRSASLNCTLCFDIIFVHKDAGRRLEILNRYLSPIVALCACLVPSMG